MASIIDTFAVAPDGTRYFAKIRDGVTVVQNSKGGYDRLQDGWTVQEGVNIWKKVNGAGVKVSAHNATPTVQHVAPVVNPAYAPQVAQSPINQQIKEWNDASDKMAQQIAKMNEINRIASQEGTYRQQEQNAVSSPLNLLDGATIENVVKVGAMFMILGLIKSLITR